MNPSNKNVIDSLATYGSANRELISEFESGRAPGEFHHADHVRVAFAYVSEFPLLEAMAKFSAALERFALSKGKPHLYHQTITWAYLLLIHERIARAGSVQCASVHSVSHHSGPHHSGSDQSSSVQLRSTLTWEEFSGRNPDLLVWKGGVLDRYYSRAVLESELARRVFVFPDRVGTAREKNALTQSG